MHVENVKVNKFVNDEVVTNSPSWDDAVSSGKFVKFLEDEAKMIVLTNCRLETMPADAKFGAGETGFLADVVWEDGAVVEKALTVTSKRLLSKLRPIMENLAVKDQVKLRILKVGDKFDTQYSVKELAR